MTSRRRSKAVTGRPSVRINGLALNGRQERWWRAANDDVESGDFRRERRGVAALTALEAELADARQAASVRAGLADTLSLERSRGEAVEVSSEGHRQARVGIRTRDGLETLVRSGAVAPSHYRAGLLYRELYEATDPERDLKSHIQDLDRRARSSPPTARSEAWAERRMRLCAAVALLEEKVRVADRNGHAVRALREIAGHARCVSHLVRGGGAQASYRRALVLALSICADHFGLTSDDSPHAPF
jgi:hypothetical protein